MIQIRKRNGGNEVYNAEKIEQAIMGAFTGLGTEMDPLDMRSILSEITKRAEADEENQNVEAIQDMVEELLMQHGYYREAKAYILYREQHAKTRKLIGRISSLFSAEYPVEAELKRVQKAFDTEEYALEILNHKFQSFLKEDMGDVDKLNALIKAAVELTTKEAPKWEFIAGRFLNMKLEAEIKENMARVGVRNLREKITYMEEQGLYGRYIREHYLDEEIDRLEGLMDEKRNELLTYSSLDLLEKRYLIKTGSHLLLERPQEMFLGIAMHLAMAEEHDREGWVKRFYDMLSKLQVTMATPTTSNARKPYHQLSSCFIDTVPDSLDGIFRTIDNFAHVSKFGGGMGLYFGKVRATGSDIRGFQGAAGGVIRWIKLANDTAVAVDQLGVRQGAVAVYLDVWHKDIPEFLQLRTNNGDDRMKAHDVFPAVCYPDLFWRLAKEDINASWYMMCPHEIEAIKGYCLEDCYGEEWERKYWDCVNDNRISKREISVKDLIRLILKSAVETGTPFAFNRDHVNGMNPNGHEGIIYCSNLCTEIAQNMSGIESVSKEIKEIDGEKIVVQTTKAGDFVVCNLASLVLGNIDVENDEELKGVITTVVRALDNVIDLNFYPVPYAQITNQRYRPVGLGVSGYHHMLAKAGIAWESEEHLEYADKVFERINYYAIAASCRLAAEKGRYELFSGSDWQTGEYFTKRGYSSEKWRVLRAQVAEQGMRNGYLLAVAPTSSTSIIAGTTASVDPVMKRFFLEEKKGSMIARVAPELSPKTFWLYKSAHTIDQSWVIRAAGVRQRHIDQSQSLNLYITNEFSMRQVLDLYVSAWEQGVKTIYYVRSQALEVEECEVCSS